MGINSMQKGKKAESEFINRFQPFFPDTIKRNLLQTREGGSDVTGAHPWVIEIKRCEKVEHNKWWKQVNAAVIDLDNEIPVVAYRQNFGGWNFQIPSMMLGISDEGYILVSEDIWLKMLFKSQGK